MNGNYLVSGAAGFIGAAIAKRLLDEGCSVVTVDNLSTGSKDNVPRGCEFIEGDVFDNNVIKKLEGYKFDAIIHIAGQSSGEVSFENPVYDLQTNTQSTIMLLDLAKKIGCKNFVYASSMSTYGDQMPDFVSEESPKTPKSFYAVGKLASENYMRIFTTFGIKCTALRFFNVYGVGQNMSNLKQGMASIYLAMAIKDHHITVKGAKDRFRDFVYVTDVVDAVLASVERTAGELFEVYNVSTGAKTTVEKIVTMIQQTLPYDVTVEYIEGTPGDQHGIYGDNSKIKAQLGWEPKYTFDKGMKIMIDWAQTLNL